MRDLLETGVIDQGTAHEQGREPQQRRVHLRYGRRDFGTIFPVDNGADSLRGLYRNKGMWQGVML
jgi:hypothetical protein